MTTRPEDPSTSVSSFPSSSGSSSATTPATTPAHVGGPVTSQDAEARVAELIDDLAAVAERPVSEHASGYEAAHEQLRGLLG